MPYYRAQLCWLLLTLPILLQYFDADFGVDELFPNLPHSADEHISNDEWSQHLAPVADYNEDREDDGSMLFADRVGVTDNTAFNTVDIDQAQSSTAISSRSVPSPNIQAPSPCTDSLTSSTPGPLSTPASSSLSYASVPNTTVDSSRYCCNECRISAKTKRDWERHLKTNKHKARGNLSNGSNDNGIPGAAPTKFHCSVEDCKYHESTGRAIAREDNLRRHVKKVHGVV